MNGICNVRFAGSIVAAVFLMAVAPTFANADSGPGRRVKDLTINELADYASTGYALYGLTPFTASIAYQGLKLDFQNVSLLQVMADLLVENEPPQLSACVYEYLYLNQNKMTSKQKRYLDASYASAMWIWGLSKRKDGSKDTQMSSFYDSSLFEFNTTGYKAMIASVVSVAGNLDAALKGVHRLLGYYGGLLEPVDEKRKLTMKDFFQPDCLRIAAKYTQWLDSPLDDFRELDRRDKQLREGRN